MDCEPDRLVWELRVRGSGPQQRALLGKKGDADSERMRPSVVSLVLGRLKKESNTAG